MNSRGKLLSPSVKSAVDQLLVVHQRDHCGLVRAGCAFLLHVCEVGCCGTLSANDVSINIETDTNTNTQTDSKIHTHTHTHTKHTHTHPQTCFSKLCVCILQKLNFCFQLFVYALFSTISFLFRTKRSCMRKCSGKLVVIIFSSKNLDTNCAICSFYAVKLEGTILPVSLCLFQSQFLCFFLSLMFNLYVSYLYMYVCIYFCLIFC